MRTRIIIILSLSLFIFVFSFFSQLFPSSVALVSRAAAAVAGFYAFSYRPSKRVQITHNNNDTGSSRCGGNRPETSFHGAAGFSPLYRYTDCCSRYYRCISFRFLRIPLSSTCGTMACRIICCCASIKKNKIIISLQKTPLTYLADCCDEEVIVVIMHWHYTAVQHDTSYAYTALHIVISSLNCSL